MGQAFKTKKGIQRHYSTSYKTVQEWCNRPNWPGGKHGPWDSDAIDAALVAIDSPLAPEQTEGQSQEQRAKLLKLLEEVRWRKLRTDNLSGKLIDKQEALESASRLMTRISDRLQACPEEITVELPPDFRDAMRNRMEEKIALILTEMSQWSLV